jgi:hypothetical protein
VTSRDALPRGPRPPAESAAGPPPRDRRHGGAGSAAPAALRDRAEALYRHLRDAERRARADGRLIDLRAAPGSAAGAVLLPLRAEPLFSGAADTLAVPGAAARPLRSPGGDGAVLRYGYPLVVLPGAPDGAAPRAVPLFTVDVAAVPGGPGLRLRATGPPGVSPALLEAVGVDRADDRAALLRVPRSAGGGSGRPAAIADLAGTARALLDRLDVGRVHDIDPERLSTAPMGDRPLAGAHNTAVLLRVDAGPGCAVPDDLDPAHPDGPRLEEVAGTALAALLGADDPQPAAPVVPVAAGAVAESHHAVLRSVLRHRLTVAAAPPGTGADGLVGAVLRTAAAAGRSVLLVCGDERVLDRAARQAAAAPALPLIRVCGGARHRADEARVLAALLRRAPADPAAPGAHRSTAHDTWAAVRGAWRALDTAASAGRDLARLAGERRRMAGLGWDADALFGPGDPAVWLRRLDRALAGGLGGASHRAAVRRELGVDPSPWNLDRLRWLAAVETEWRVALDRADRTGPPERSTAGLATALAAHRRAAAEHLATAVDARAALGRTAVARRLESLNWHRDAAAPGVGPLLTAVPAWAATPASARGLPASAARFDLVVVAAADRLPAADLPPLLYRGARALVVGDPAAPAPPEPPAARWPQGLDPLRSAASAYGAAEAAVGATGRRPVWLDEHDRCHPAVARPAARHLYGGRVAVRSDPAERPDPLAAGPGSRGGGTGPDGGAARIAPWQHVAGVCEPVLGGSCRNRAEAAAAADLVRRLDALLPEGVRVGVHTPFQPQAALLRRLLAGRPPRRAVRVGGTAPFADDVEDAVDVMVLSPACAGDDPPHRVLAAARAAASWAVPLTRTLARLIVVGDRGLWGGDDGVLGDLCRAAGQEAVAPPPGAAAAALAAALRERGAAVAVGPEYQGVPADLAVHGPRGTVLVLVDRAPTGAALRRLLDHRALVARVSGLPAVRVPAWRCLHDPAGTAAGIAADVG